MARVFLDSGVLVQGIATDWGAAKALLILGSYKILDLETSQVVIAEVTAALERKGIPTGPRSDFARSLKLLRLTVHPRPAASLVQEALPRFLPLLRHRADIAVLVAAMSTNPDWLVSGNLDHFTPAVARASGLRIVSPS